jgi:hypothetical protein
VVDGGVPWVNAEETEKGEETEGGRKAGKAGSRRGPEDRRKAGGEAKSGYGRMKGVGSRGECAVGGLGVGW